MQQMLFNREYNISAENDITRIMNNIESEYILNIIIDTMTQGYVYNIGNSVNIVNSYEYTFKSLLDEYQGGGQQEIIEKRNEVYLDIIKAIASFYHFNLVDDLEEIEKNITALTYWMYDFFVCNFASYIIKFFIEFIKSQKTAIYDSMCIGDTKKDKSSSVIYAKKIYKNDFKLGLINANLNMVISNMLNPNFDITFNTILNFVYPKEISDLLNRFLIPQDENEMFSSFFCRPFRTGIREPEYITAIRLGIHRDIIEAKGVEE